MMKKGANKSAMSAPPSQVLLTSTKESPLNYPECGSLFTPVSWDDLYKKAGENVQMASRWTARSVGPGRSEQEEIPADDPSRTLTCFATPPDYRLEFDLSPPLLFANPSPLSFPQAEPRPLSAAPLTQPASQLPSASLVPQPTNPLLSTAPFPQPTNPPLSVLPFHQPANPPLSAASFQQFANPPFSTASFRQPTNPPLSAVPFPKPANPSLSQWLFANPPPRSSTGPESPPPSASHVPGHRDTSSHSCLLAPEEDTSSARETKQGSVTDAVRTLPLAEDLRPAGVMDSPRPTYVEEEEEEGVTDASKGMIGTMYAEELKGDPVAGGATFWRTSPEDLTQPELADGPLPTDVQEEEEEEKEEEGVADAGKGMIRKMYAVELKGDPVAGGATFWRMPPEDLTQLELLDAPWRTRAERQVGITDTSSSIRAPLVESSSNLSLTTTSNGISLVASRGSAPPAWSSSSKSTSQHVFHKTHPGTEAPVSQNKPVDQAARCCHESPHPALRYPVLAEYLSATQAPVIQHKPAGQAERCCDESTHAVSEHSAQSKFLSTTKSFGAPEPIDQDTRSRGESPRPALLTHPAAVEYLSHKSCIKQTKISIVATRDAASILGSRAPASDHVVREQNTAVLTHEVATRLRHKAPFRASMAGKGAFAIPRERVERPRWRRSFLRSLGARGSAPPLTAIVRGSSDVRPSLFPPKPAVEGVLFAQLSSATERNYAGSPRAGENGVDCVSASGSESTIKLARNDQTSCIYQNGLVDSTGNASEASAQAPLKFSSHNIDSTTGRQAEPRGDLTAVEVRPQEGIRGMPEPSAAAQPGAISPPIPPDKVRTLTAARPVVPEHPAPPKIVRQYTIARHVASQSDTPIEIVYDVSPVSTAPIQEVSPISTVPIQELSPVSTPSIQEGSLAHIELPQKPPSGQVSAHKARRASKESEGSLVIVPECKTPSPGKEPSIPRDRSSLYHALQLPRVTAALSSLAPPSEPIGETQISSRHLASVSPRRPYQHCSTSPLLSLQQSANTPPNSPRQHGSTSHLFYPHQPPNASLRTTHQTVSASPRPPHRRGSASSLLSLQQPGRTSPLVPQQWGNASPRPPQQRGSASSLLSLQQPGRTSPIVPQQWVKAPLHPPFSSHQPGSTTLLHKSDPSLINAQQPSESQSWHRCRVVPPPCTVASPVQQRSTFGGSLRLAPTLAQSPPVPPRSTLICNTPRFPGTPQWPAPHLMTKNMSGAATPALGVTGLIRPPVLSAPMLPQPLPHGNCQIFAVESPGSIGFTSYRR